MGLRAFLLIKKVATEKGGILGWNWNSVSVTDSGSGLHDGLKERDAFINKPHLTHWDVKIRPFIYAFVGVAEPKTFLSAPTPSPRSRKSELWLRLQLRLLSNYLVWLECQYFFYMDWCMLYPIRIETVIFYKNFCTGSNHDFFPIKFLQVFDK